MYHTQNTKMATNIPTKKDMMHVMATYVLTPSVGTVDVNVMCWINVNIDLNQLYVNLYPMML